MKQTCIFQMNEDLILPCGMGKVRAKAILVLIGVLMLFSGSVHSQEQEWEPQTRITGYIATEFDYFNNLIGFDREWGMSLSEAGVLINYMPTQNITLNSVIVYRPNFSIDQIINEASAEWKGADFFKVKAGRFLTPISPMNTYYYAPVNNSATLPMIIASHELFPINMNAVSINGSLGENIKMKYNVFAGGYYNSLWLKTGPIGFFGVEGDYFTKMGIVTFDINSGTYNNEMNFAKGIHVDFSYMDYFNIGLNIFDPSSEKTILSIPLRDSITGAPIINPLTQQQVVIAAPLELNKFVYGASFKAKVKNFQVLGEYWHQNMPYTSNLLPIDDNLKSDAIFIEASGTFNKLTPYIRYENHDVLTKYERYTAGLNFKPIFEITLKAEFMIYKHNSYDLQGLVGSLIYSF